MFPLTVSVLVPIIVAAQVVPLHIAGSGFVTFLSAVMPHIMLGYTVVVAISYPLPPLLRLLHKPRPHPPARRHGHRQVEVPADHRGVGVLL